MYYLVLPGILAVVWTWAWSQDPGAEVQISAPKLGDCAALGFVPHCPHILKDDNHSSHLIGLIWELNKLVYIYIYV